MRHLKIANIDISDDSDCFVIAEIGNNHQGSVKTCKEMFKIAKECGAHAVKLQKRDNKALYTKAMYDKPYDNENSYGPTYGLHRDALEFGAQEYRELKAYAQELDIIFFSTAFDQPSVDFLESIDLPAYKVASGDLRSTTLLKHVASTQKPIFLSTGGGTMEDVQRAYDAIMPINPRLCILQCTAGYPCEFNEMNLKVIETFRQLYPTNVIGLSSHDNGIAMAVAGYAFGARAVEKHFTLNRAWKGTDHKFSLEPVGLRKMVRDLQRVRIAIGDGRKQVYPSEVAPIQKMSKKIVASRDLPQGHVLAAEDLAFKSPGDGLPVYELDKLLGRTINKPLKEDDSITWSELAG